MKYKISYLIIFFLLMVNSISALNLDKEAIERYEDFTSITDRRDLLYRELIRSGLTRNDAINISDEVAEKFDEITYWQNKIESDSDLNFVEKSVAYTLAYPDEQLVNLLINSNTPTDKFHEYRNRFANNLQNILRSPLPMYNLGDEHSKYLFGLTGKMNESDLSELDSIIIQAIDQNDLYFSTFRLLLMIRFNQAFDTDIAELIWDVGYGRLSTWVVRDLIIQDISYLNDKESASWFISKLVEVRNKTSLSEIDLHLIDSSFYFLSERIDEYLVFMFVNETLNLKLGNYTRLELQQRLAGSLRFFSPPYTSSGENVRTDILNKLITQHQLMIKTLESIQNFPPSPHSEHDILLPDISNIENDDKSDSN